MNHSIPVILRNFQTRTWLIILVALLMLFVLPTTTNEADALTWDNEYIVASNDVEHKPKIVVEGDNVYVVYTQGPGGASYLYLRWFDGTQWSAPIQVSAVGASKIEHPAIAVDDGVVHIAYSDISDGYADIMYRTFNGMRLSPIVHVSTEEAYDRSMTPAIAVDGENAYIAWVEGTYTGADIFFSNGTAGTQWSSPIEISTDNVNTLQRDPDIAAEDGVVHVVWVDYKDGNEDIVYRRFDGTTWTDEEEISNDDDNQRQYSPVVEVDGSDIYVAYLQRNRNNDSIYMVIYDGSWGTGQIVDSPHANEYGPRIGVEAGHVVLVYDSTTSASPDSVYLRHWNGLTWEPPVLMGQGSSVDTYRSADVSLQSGSAHVAFHRSGDSGTQLKYQVGRLDEEDPQAEVKTIGPFWMAVAGVPIQWTASDDYELVSVTVEYRFSGDNSYWNRWTHLATKDSLHGTDASGTIRFDPPDGDGFYQFRAIATDISGKTDSSSTMWEARGALDTIVPTGTLAINGGTYYTNNAKVILNLTATDWMTDRNGSQSGNEYKVRFSDDGIIWSKWEPADATKDWVLPGVEGRFIVHYQVMDAAGLISEPISDTVVLDRVPPDIDVIINDGDEWTTSRTVTLTIISDDSDSGVAGIRISGEDIGGDGPWEDPVETMQWEIPELDGTYRVYYQAVDHVGWTSEVFYAEIGLDTVAPTGSIEVDTVRGTTTESWVTLLLTYDDLTSGAHKVRFSEVMSAITDMTWEDPAETREWYLGTDGGVKAVHFQVMDAAGHLSEVYRAIVLLDLDKPTGTLVIEGGRSHVNDAEVLLGLTFHDETSDVVGIRISNEAIGGDEPWEDPVETMTWILEGADGEKTIYYQVLDASGQASVVYMFSVTLDTIAPYVVSTDPEDGETDVDTNSTIVIVFSEPMDTDSVESSIRIWYTYGFDPDIMNGTDFEWSSDGRMVTFNAERPPQPSPYFTVMVGKASRDLAGNQLDSEVEFKYYFVRSDQNDNGENGSFWGLVVVLVIIVAVVVALVGYILLRRGKEGG